MPQNEYIERWQKQHGKRFDHDERVRKREAREGHAQSQSAQNLRGLRAKLHQKKRHAEKIQMKKAIKAQEERDVKSAAPTEPSSTPLPNYLLDRSQANHAKALSSAIKNKRAEKAAKFSVPLPKVKGISEEEMFKVVKTGKKTAKKSWKRVITQPTFVGPDFTRRPVKYERFIRPMGLRYKKANVTHPELAVTVQLPIISVKKNPQNPLYTQLGVLTKVGSDRPIHLRPFSSSTFLTRTRALSSKSMYQSSDWSPRVARSCGANTLRSPTTPAGMAV